MNMLAILFLTTIVPDADLGRVLVYLDAGPPVSVEDCMSAARETNLIGKGADGTLFAFCIPAEGTTNAESDTRVPPATAR